MRCRNWDERSMVEHAFAVLIFLTAAFVAGMLRRRNIEGR